MGADRKGPLAAFVVIAVIAAVLLVTSVRSQAAPGWLDPDNLPASIVAAPPATDPHLWGAVTGGVHQVVREGVVLVKQATSDDATVEGADAALVVAAAPVLSSSDTGHSANVVTHHPAHVATHHPAHVATHHPGHVPTHHPQHPPAPHPTDSPAPPHPPRPHADAGDDQGDDPAGPPMSSSGFAPPVPGHHDGWGSGNGYHDGWGSGNGYHDGWGGGNGYHDGWGDGNGNHDGWGSGGGQAPGNQGNGYAHGGH